MISSLPVSPAHALPSVEADAAWLIEELWGDEAVGIVGGEPKCCKSFLALDMAVAVATGAPCLGRFVVRRPGRVLLFAAEDPLHVVRTRLAGIAAAAGRVLEEVDVHVITAPSLRLDIAEQRGQLAATIEDLRPRLVVLDPFVRLHRVDENVSAEVAPLLAYLRDLQRAHHVAVVLVHHAKKGAAKARAGQALRGSSEFHAWGDSNLYLRRIEDQLTLAIEHRAARSTSGLKLALGDVGGGLALRLVDPPTQDAEGAPKPDVAIAIENLLREASEPLSVPAIRRTCRARTQTVYRVLQELEAAGRIVRSSTGYALAR